MLLHDTFSVRVCVYTQGMTTTTATTNNDIAELVALLPENLVERYPNAEQRIYWMRDNYGVTLKMAFQANKIISAI